MLNMHQKLTLPKTANRRRAILKSENRSDFDDFEQLPTTRVRRQPAVVVAVNQKSQASNSLGISSLVVGILSFFVCWIPVIGFSLGGLGVVLGGIGLFMAMTRKGSGAGYAIAGTAVSSIAVITGVVFMIMTAAAVQVASDTVEELDKALAEQRAKHNKEQLARRDQRDARQVNNGQGNIPNIGDQPAEKPPAEPAWVLASQPQHVGSVQIRITEVVVGKVPLHRTILDQDSESADPLLLIRLSITNMTQGKKIDYSGWMGDYASLRDIDSELTDNNDNRYKSVTFGATTDVKDAETSTSIYPGKTHADAIVFELPIEGVEYLRLKLSAKAFGEDGEIRFQIPRGLIVDSGIIE